MVINALYFASQCDTDLEPAVALDGAVDRRQQGAAVRPYGGDWAHASWGLHRATSPQVSSYYA